MQMYGHLQTDGIYEYLWLLFENRANRFVVPFIFYQMYHADNSVFVGFKKGKICVLFCIWTVMQTARHGHCKTLIYVPATISSLI